MTKCMYCDGQTLEGQDLADPYIHRVCINERGKRQRTKKCIECGKNDWKSKLEMWCQECENKCHANNKFSFEGYNGPPS